MQKYPFKKFWKRLGIATLDLIGGILFFPIRFFPKNVDPSKVRKILLIRLDHIGDVVMTRPAFRAIHKKFPHAQIDLLVHEETALLFEQSCEFTTVLSSRNHWFARKSGFWEMLSEFWRLRALIAKQDYDIGIDFRGDLRNILLLALGHVRYRIGYGVTGGGFLLNRDVPYQLAQHQVLLNLNLLSSFHIAHDNKLLPFDYLAEKGKAFWKKIGGLPPTTLLPRVVIHAESGYPSKQWPFENFRDLIQRIDREAIAQMILIGTAAEKEKRAALELNSERLIDLRGKTSLEDLPILFDVCDLFIGHDSGPSHIAAAQGLEIILLASGTNDIRSWHPWTERLRLLHHEVPCAPCQKSVCPVEGHPCMEKITVDQTYDAFLSVLARLQKRT